MITSRWPYSLTAVLVALSLCWACGPESAESGDPDPAPTTDAELADIVEPLETIRFGTHGEEQSLFASGDHRFDYGEPFRQISMFVAAADISDLAYRIEKTDGDTSDWQHFEIRWAEGDMFHLLARLDDPAQAVELRGAEALTSGKITFHRHVVAPDADGQRPAFLDNFDPQTGELQTPDQPDVETRHQAVAPSSLVISQSEWGSDEPGKLCGFAHNPDDITIHHTAVPATDGGDPAARMRGMQSYHKSIGWCDIGYHFVVSQDARIYQGRSQSGRTGAHVLNNNTDNLGIALIGNYDVDTPPQGQLDAAAQIMEWVHQEHGVPLDTNSVHGHQEWPAQGTSCPGTNLLDQLSDLAAAAADDPGDPEDTGDGPEPGGCTPTADADATGLFDDYNTAATGYEEAVRLYEHGITLGCNQSPLMFCPDCPLTRSQMATFLVRAANIDTSDPPAESSFDDVSTNASAFPYIEAAYDAGITQGCGDDKFCPGQQITRAQAAAMIQGARNWPDEVPSDAPTFDDVDASSTHFEAVETINQRCVTEGCGAGEFCPNDALTRGQAAAFISNAFNLDGSNPCAEPGGCSPEATLGATDSEFVDFPTGDFGYEEATLLADADITLGCSQFDDLDPAFDSDVAYCPACPTTRRQMVIFLVRGIDLDTSNPPAESSFDDVETDATGFAEIEAAYEAGIINGCGNDNFCPTDDVRRNQVATMIKRALDWDAPDVSEPTFDDVPESSIHFDGVEALNERCVTSGCRTDEFCPDGSVPRSHMAVFVARALNLDDINPCAEVPGDGEGPKTSPDAGPGQTDGDECDDVDPDFVPSSCEDEELATDGPGDGYPDADEDGEPADDDDDGGADDDGESDDDGDDGEADGEDDSEDDDQTDEETSEEVETSGCTTVGGAGGPASLLVVLLIGLAGRRFTTDQTSTSRNWRPDTVSTPSDLSRG